MEVKTLHKLTVKRLLSNHTCDVISRITNRKLHSCTRGNTKWRQWNKRSILLSTAVKVQPHTVVIQAEHLDNFFSEIPFYLSFGGRIFRAMCSHFLSQIPSWGVKLPVYMFSAPPTGLNKICSRSVTRKCYPGHSRLLSSLSLMIAYKRYGDNKWRLQRSGCARGFFTCFILAFEI